MRKQSINIEETETDREEEYKIREIELKETEKEWAESRTRSVMEQIRQKVQEKQALHQIIEQLGEEGISATCTDHDYT